MRTAIRNGFALLLVAMLTAIGMPATATGAPELFAAGAEGRSTPEGSVRTRSTALLTDLGIAPGPLTVTLNLFADTTVTTTLEREVAADGAIVWAGTVPGRTGTSVLLVWREGHVFGNAHLGVDGEYTIGDNGDGTLTIREADPMALAAESAPLVPQGVEAGPALPTPRTTPVIDVMIVWSTEVRNGSAPLDGFGGSAAAGRAWAATRIAELNTILDDSLIDADARLAFAGTADFYDEGEDSETDVAEDLYNLTFLAGEDCSGNPGIQLCDPEGYLDRELAQRDLIGADVLVLVVADSNQLGIAWSICTNGPGADPDVAGCTASRALAVAEFGAADTFYTMAHEIGHVFGGLHDGSNQTNPPYDGTGYNRGYRVTEAFATVMSYECDLVTLPQPAACEASRADRVGFYSNPDVLWEGSIPMGIPIGDFGEADIASHFGVSLPIVSGFTSHDDCRGRVPTILGTDSDDTIVGTSDDDVIMTFGGADTIDGLEGDDLICAGDGADVINGGDGKDKIYGEDGADTLYGNEKSDHLYGGNGTDTLRGNGGTRDRLYGGGGIDDLNAGTGTDDRCTTGETYANCEVMF